MIRSPDVVPYSKGYKIKLDLSKFDFMDIEHGRSLRDFVREFESSTKIDTYEKFVELAGEMANEKRFFAKEFNNCNKEQRSQEAEYSARCWEEMASRTEEHYINPPQKSKMVGRSPYFQFPANPVC